MRAATDVNQSGEIDVKDFELAIEVSGAEMVLAKKKASQKCEYIVKSACEKCWYLHMNYSFIHQQKSCANVFQFLCLVFCLLLFFFCPFACTVFANIN